MDRAIIDFIAALRHHKLPVSPAETLDALKAVNIIGVADRQRLKTTLSLTLAKTLRHRGQLENLFDHFFAVQDTLPLPAIAGSDDALSDGLDASLIESRLGRQLLDDDWVKLQRSVVMAAESAGVQNMQIFLQKKMVSTRILQALGDRELMHELRTLESREQQLQLVAELQRKREQLIDVVNDYVEQQFVLFSSQKGRQLSDDNLHKLKLNHIDSVQIQHMQRLIYKVAKKLATLHSRQRKVSKRGHLDVRKTLAANAAFDGFLIRTRWKATRIDKPKVMVICDVSGSVSTYARFLLMFVYALQDVMPRVRSFVFSNQLGEVSHHFKELPVEGALELITQRWSGYSTDYGRALQDFSDLALHQVDHNTQVIILGDARNNYDDGRTDILKTLYTRAQRVLWLNPEERSRWNTGDSIMSDYAPYCSLLESCNTLRDMERILGRLLKYS